ncbi:hypothetical protein EZS27_028312 [termite gut metagenome]|jgi:hypothetical protein|uniref:PLD phosphodiesterase domain-containing protein n=1 Tax=termite gut metagenome TaxID=433724 RepID=A0A5J4QJI6_9ZZZZ
MSKTFYINSDNSSLRMHECDTDEYWFYHKGSYSSDNPLLYQQIVDNATEEIIIWDPYFNVKLPHRDQNIFSNIQSDVTIKILTCKGLNSSLTYLNEVKDAIKLVIPERKDCRFGLRVINNGDVTNQRDRFFHDRFLFIDNADVYLIGSSVGYHLKSEKSTGIFKVANSETKDFIISIFKYYWDNSAKHEIPVAYLHL